MSYREGPPGFVTAARCSAPARKAARPAPDRLGVIVKEALANGRLAERDDMAIAIALRQPWADVVLSGAVTAGQLHSNLRALEITPSDHEIESLRRSAERPERYWSMRAARPWV